MKLAKLPLIGSAFVFAMLLNVNTSFAQVKIGTNPTTIGPSSNLEVEAANNKKVIIDRNIGTVQIENLPPGAATDSIVTADQTGVLRAIGRDQLLRVLNLSGSGQMKSGSQALAQGANRPNYSVIPFDQEGGADLTANTFTIQRDGFYTVSASVNVQIPLAGAAGATGSFTFSLRKNGANIGSYSSPQTPRGFTVEGQVNELVPCVAGDVFTVNVVPCNGCGVGQVGFSIVNSSLTLLKNY